MADHLHTNGYHIPAASIAGAVLEDSLRRLHLKRIGPWQGDSGITKLNDGLRKADVYSQSVWRQTQVWGDIRNDADHGHFEKVNADHVRLMAQGIRISSQSTRAEASALSRRPLVPATAAAWNLRLISATD